ncbi:hypothetical protein H5S09_09815 [Limosilactobacillus sp. STM2_1]|uniref:Uncharacterized protein n=1 Tax=Limosilactobacillus rudii TaxID=2759755 RepID=A0A7W3UN98_9LACO|nr:hypothetical protein [Limosilactobacillus rudii]MBB1078894.1 hypothetical protein [Limosilactobacillus rudii]MBB1098230.1 hypothetical protein [Limosilactobacillus rudii]MCD7135655.1 hypothetical protein [Limosilactobacillus rudii]
MDAQDKLNRQYENKSIYTAGFYADPDNNLANRKKLFDTLKSLVMNQDASTPFSLQIMMTNSEINIMPLGLLDLNELKEYEKKQREIHGLDWHSDEIPLIIQYSPHTEDGKVVKKTVCSTQKLFADFNTQIENIWQTVKDFLNDNFAILSAIVKDLIADKNDVQKEYYTTFSKMSAAEREEKLGFTVDTAEVEQFSEYMANMHEVQAIVLSAGSFANHELLGKNSFSEMISDNVRRSTLFWVLDNTFYEIYYYFYNSNENSKLRKRLNHQRENLIVNMRNDAFHRAQELVEKQQKKVDFNEYFSDIFIPVAEQIVAEINKFKD